MTQISIATGAIGAGSLKRSYTGAPRLSIGTSRAEESSVRSGSRNGKALLGAPKPKAQKDVVTFAPEPTPEIKGVSASAQNVSPSQAKQLQGDLQKTVRKMPTLYVIAFFGVVVFCAVAIIWNTLQVNKLTLERTRNEEKIAQHEQRLIKLRAQEMQLSAPSRVRDIAKAKLGMVEESGDETIVLQ
jgi:cell division protein FtsL